MADFEDLGEKTESPTPHRRSEARERGQVAKSPELAAALGLLGGLAALNLLGPRILDQLLGLTRRMLSGEAGGLRPDSMLASARVGFATASNVLLPLALAVAAAAVAANLIQVGFVASWHPLKPDLNKISPIRGLGRLFSRRNLVRLVVNVAKVAVIGWVSWATIDSRMGQLVGLSGMDFWPLVGAASELVFVLALRVALVLLVLALLDYGYTKFQHEQDLRMTRQEVREELKRMEGDPTLRARRLRIARQLAMQRIGAEVPRADVIVTNPEHVAVALRYDPNEMTAPRVLAKGVDLVAEHIRRIAIEHRIPIVRRPPLARAIYATCQVGQEIPSKFYKAVAEVLAYVYELSGKGRRKPAARREAMEMASAN